MVGAAPPPGLGGASGKAQGGKAHGLRLGPSTGRSGFQRSTRNLPTIPPLPSPQPWLQQQNGLLQHSETQQQEGPDCSSKAVHPPASLEGQGEGGGLGGLWMPRRGRWQWVPKRGA